MSSWYDLEAQFRQLEPSMEEARLERQWDDAAEEWRMAGRVDLESATRFRQLAAEAGTLLAGQDVAVPQEVAGETDATRRWYRALWHLGGPHETPIAGLMSMHGRSAGSVSIGRVLRPAHTSAALARRFGAAPLR